MSTLMLEDLNSNARRALGLNESRACSCTKPDRPAALRIVEIARLPEYRPTMTPVPGALWLNNGLHRLRVPPFVRTHQSATVDQPR